jgi:hypothetical protein
MACWFCNTNNNPSIWWVGRQGMREIGSAVETIWYLPWCPKSKESIYVFACKNGGKDEMDLVMVALVVREKHRERERVGFVADLWL